MQCPCTDVFAIRDAKIEQVLYQARRGRSGKSDREIRSALVPASSRRATRRFIAKDFPVPGPAITRSGVFAVEAMLRAGPARPSSQGMLPAHLVEALIKR